MIVVIPSRGRADCVKTLQFMPESQQVALVVPTSEVSAYASHNRRLRTEIHGADFEHIGQKRQWIIEKYRGRKLVMLDDDLRFRRRYATNNGFVAADQRDIEHMLRMLFVTLDSTPHAGIADEFMCQHQPRGYRVGGRYNQVLAYNLSLVQGPAPRFRLAINEEHDFHLQLLRRGHRPIVLTDWTKGSKYNASGGCSTWRTPEFEKAQFEEFQRLWPDLVTIVPNKNSISGLATRVKWRNA